MDTWKTFWLRNPGEMLADYFKGDMVRVLTVVVALCFSVPYLGLQLAASGNYSTFYQMVCGV